MTLLRVLPDDCDRTDVDELLVVTRLGVLLVCGRTDVDLPDVILLL